LAVTVSVAVIFIVAMSLGVGASIFDVDVVWWTEARIRSVWPSLCFPPISLLHRAR
jgi:hypothetical protein